VGGKEIVGDGRREGWCGAVWCGVVWSEGRWEGRSGVVYFVRLFEQLV
jgi:hypothetical protein